VQLLVTAVPEPSAALLLLLGGCLAARRQRSPSRTGSRA